MNVSYTTIETDHQDKKPIFSRDEIATFLKKSLEQYGDEKKAILKCIAYAYSDSARQGGFIEIAHEKDRIVGAVIINNTNMGDYIPEHILVYIAVDPSTRGLGVGKGLMKRVIQKTEGDIALHVEPDNPAKFLYEKLGFTNKYLEMRLKK